MLSINPANSHSLHRFISFPASYVFWFGDLNFRLNDDLGKEPEEIRKAVHDDRLPELIGTDQLLMCRQQGRAFTELEERLPAFPPTFKFEHGTTDYDMKRRPAWCDRILYKKPQAEFKNINLLTEQTSYRSHPQFNISDHKPVSSEFTIQVRNGNIAHLVFHSMHAQLSPVPSSAL